ncbi:hypothetical protein C0Q70_20601 [Pomacea canaliculata]|uniref:Uncharacterized protein n=1 Tax=Pomacea canaliculata TaxID=400727 RepID=A0A2T7NG00_POMCA|nr:hypothetical protein C0Q70_20601 [Pomacea canaliculata]
MAVTWDLRWLAVAGRHPVSTTARTSTQTSGEAPAATDCRRRSQRKRLPPTAARCQSLALPDNTGRRSYVAREESACRSVELLPSGVWCLRLGIASTRPLYIWPHCVSSHTPMRHFSGLYSTSTSKRNNDFTRTVW